MRLYSKTSRTPNWISYYFFVLSQLNKSDPDHYRCASGFYVDLIIKLSEKLQFTYEIYEVEDRAWGGKSASGEWNGLMKDLITNKADLAMTSLKVTKERSEYIDFSVPFMETVNYTSLIGFVLFFWIVFICCSRVLLSLFHCDLVQYLRPLS